MATATEDRPPLPHGSVNLVSCKNEEEEVARRGFGFVHLFC